MSQAPEERNYHVFYYLLSGADAETKAELQLMDIDCYKYLTQVSDATHPALQKELTLISLISGAAQASSSGVRSSQG